MSDPMRVSGLTQSQEVMMEVTEEADRSVGESEVEVPGLSDAEDPKKPSFRRGNTGFTRFRVGMDPDDRSFIVEMNAEIEAIHVRQFADAYEIMNQLYDVVRIAEVDEETGEPLRTPGGLVRWARNDYGGFDEDWTRLGIYEREHFLFSITTRLFEWEQRSIAAWGAAMMAKAQWEERFSDAYLSPEQKTVAGKTADSRENFAKRAVSEDRYSAIYETTLSRRADAVVRTMTLLGQRLKDTA